MNDPFLTKETLFKGNLGAAISIDAKAVTEEGEFEGYGSVFGNKDRGGDIVASGAFLKSLANRPAQSVKMLWQHQSDKIIGQWLDMREDAKGLYCRGKILTEVQAGREAYALLKAGALDGLSIGYRVVTDEYDRDIDVRRILEAELMEVSLVTFPMNEAATVSLVKGDKIPTEREFERFLVRDAGFSAQQAKAIIAKGYKSLTTERDAGDGDDESVLEALRGLRESLS